MLIAAALGFFVRGAIDKGGGGGDSAGTIAQVPEGAVDPSVERFRVPVGNAPVKGSPTAKVTIIEFSDFQCPFCSRVVGTLEQIETTYNKNVRVAFKQNPLPFHPNAGPAAEASLAANEQGKFWEMHDKLFKNQQNLSRADFEKYAQELGLDLNKFKAALDSGKFKAQIQADQAEAAKYGARGTPAFFINGRFLSGAQPFDTFKRMIDEELAAADRAMKAGVAAAQVYDALTKNGKDSAGGGTPAGQVPPKPQAALEDQVYKVPVGDSPVKGQATAKVTIVEFSDFQCPFCSRVETTLQQVQKEYGDKIRVVWKNNPLPFHNNAMPAAEASMAANEQGKFWEMHEALFKNQQNLDGPSIEKYAQEIGLNMGKFKAAMDSHKFKKNIETDMQLANQIGARGTPTFFINGKPFRGAQPFESFKSAIDGELKNAEATLARGVAPAALYAELTKNGLEKAPAPPPPAGQPDPNVVYKALVGDAPVRGAKNAKVTIVEWSDFQCPFCGRVEPTVDEVLKAYPNDVRVAFKQLPLPFHNNAHAAAEASLAAKEQGKFWEMHKKLFTNQQALDRPNLEKYAQELGLDMGKFKAALDTNKYKEKVDQELAEGNKIGARGTPTFFINGKIFVGAQPLEAFKARIDEELKNADSIMAKAKVKAGDALYAYLMKDAKDAPAAAPAKGGDEAEDKTVYKVDPGNGPSVGPVGAPVQIVEFSDFQCPFCSRVVPTMEKVLEKYRGKVRITWRNYPLPFHQNAGPAAEAALAAHEQGKFWEMYDKLFKNQGSLDRPSFEKYAQEIGLDMGKFKAALDSGKYKAAVQADVTYANSLPGGGMGTPTFFINGHKIAGAYPFEEFAKVIDAELAKKGK
jgi:protein-disulfide isomerase